MMSAKSSPAHRAFTLIEVLVAVAILAFTATAALKLVFLAQNGLVEAGKKQKLLDEAQSLQLGIRLGNIETFGMSGDITWDTAYKEREMFDKDFGRLVFSDQKNVPVTKIGEITWRELTVKNKDSEKIILYLPAAINSSQKDNISGDESENLGNNTN